MAVVKGDRIGESRKLNLRSPEVQDFYAHFIASVPDSFGRFRVSAQHVHIAMYPRREPTADDFARIKRMLADLGDDMGADAALFNAWEVDGVTFGELTNWRPDRRQTHGAPEPPWTAHKCSQYCAKSAAYQAKLWGTREQNAPSNGINNLRARKSNGGESDAHQVAQPYYRIDTPSEYLLPAAGAAGPPAAEAQTPQPDAEPQPRIKAVKRVTAVSVTSTSTELVLSAPEAAKARAPSWSEPYEALWRRRWGDESEPPSGEIRKWCSKAREKLGDVETLKRWERFLAASEASQFARPHRFLQGLGEWGDSSANPVVRRGRDHGVTAGNVAEVTRWLEHRSGGIGNGRLGPGNSREPGEDG